MKKTYDTPFLDIEYFEFDEDLLAYSQNNPGYIPDTDEDDFFGDL